VFAKSEYSVKSNEKLSLEFPTSLIEFKRSRKNNAKIINHLKENFEEERRCHTYMKTRTFVTDYLTYLYQLIQPNIREVIYPLKKINVELLNYEEKIQLKQAVSLLSSLGIKLQDSEEHQFFEPDIKSLLDFKVVFELI
jgi:hypothetical protein